MTVTRSETTNRKTLLWIRTPPPPPPPPPPLPLAKKKINLASPEIFHLSSHLSYSFLTTIPLEAKKHENKKKQKTP